jgi:predicted phage tail component-like protein
VITFTYNSISSRTYSIVAKSVNRPILPVLRKRELVVPGKHGTYDFQVNTFDKRIIEVELRYVGTSIAELRTRARQIAYWLSGFSGNKNLVFSDEPDKYYIGKIYSEIGLQSFLRRGEATIIFECQPFAYDVGDTICSYDETLPYDAAYAYDTGLIYPNCRTSYDWYFLAPFFNVRNANSRLWCGFGWSYNPHMTGLYNHATAETPLTISIFGDVTNPRIYQETTSAQLTISGTITASTLVIDSDNMQVTLNGSNYVTTISGEFFNLSPGANGFFFYGVSPHAEVTFSWQHRWL